jgi:hypothetical protein
MRERGLNEYAVTFCERSQVDAEATRCDLSESPDGGIRWYLERAQRT